MLCFNALIIARRPPAPGQQLCNGSAVNKVRDPLVSWGDFSLQHYNTHFQAIPHCYFLTLLIVRLRVNVSLWFQNWHQCNVESCNSIIYLTVTPLIDYSAAIWNPIQVLTVNKNKGFYRISNHRTVNRYLICMCGGDYGLISPLTINAFLQMAKTIL